MRRRRRTSCLSQGFRPRRHCLPNGRALLGVAHETWGVWSQAIPIDRSPQRLGQGFSPTRGRALTESVAAPRRSSQPRQNADVLDQRLSLFSPLDGVRRSGPSEVAFRAGLPPRKRLSQDASRCRSQAFSTSQRFNPTQPLRPCFVPQPSPGFSPSEVSPRRNHARLSAPLALSRLSADPPDGVTWALSPVVSSNACLATSSHDSQSHVTLARVPHRLRTPFPRLSCAVKRGHPRPATHS